MSKPKSHLGVILLIAIATGVSGSASASPPVLPGDKDHPANFDPRDVQVKTLPGKSRLKVEGTGGLPGARPDDEVQGGYVVHRRSFARTPAFATLMAGSATLVAAAIVGGLALSRANGFRSGLAAGASMDELLTMRGTARELAFACDLLAGTTAALGLATLVLRFGTVSSIPAPDQNGDIESAFQPPGSLR